MYKNAKIVFYFNQYFGIRLGEKVYAFTPEIEKFSLLRAFGSLLFHYWKNFKTPAKDGIKKNYRHLVYIETLNQKNAIIDVFTKMEEKNRKEVLFVLNNNVSLEGFDTVVFNNRKLFFSALLFFPKAVCLSGKYVRKNKGIINTAHIYVNLAVFMASAKLFESYMQSSGCEKIVLTNDHNIKPLGLLLAAKSKRVTSYYIQHASVSEVFPKLLPDVALLEGQQAVDTYRKIGSLSKEQQLVGIARMDGLLGYKKRCETEHISVGICLKPYYSEALLNELIAVVKKSKAVSRVILRPHPGNSEKFYKFLESFDVEISNARQERPHEFIKNIDVMISGESSIILEAALMKVKTIYIDDGVAQFDLYGFIKNGITTFAQNTEKITQMLNEIDSLQIENQYANCKYYCSTVNTSFENKSRELILKHLIN